MGFGSHFRNTAGAAPLRHTMNIYNDDYDETRIIHLRDERIMQLIVSGTRERDTWL